MRAVLAITLAAALVPGPGLADKVVFDPAPLEACWQDQGRAAACTGEGSGPCMEATPFGTSTMGMVACLAAELDWWERLMARLLADLRAAEAAFDAAPDPVLSDPPSAVAALDRVQRLWIDWARARCDYEVIEFLAGTIRGPIGVGCHLELTARQAEYLAGRLRGHEAR